MGQYCSISEACIDSLDSLIKHTLQVSLRQCTALEVLHRLDILRNLYCLLILDRRHLPLSQLFSHLWVVSQVELGAYEDNRDIWRMVLSLWIPLQPVSSACIAFTPELTLALTLSNDDGETMLKQMRKTSV